MSPSASCQPYKVAEALLVYAYVVRIVYSLDLAHRRLTPDFTFIIYIMFLVES